MTQFNATQAAIYAPEEGVSDPYIGKLTHACASLIFWSAVFYIRDILEWPRQKNIGELSPAGQSGRVAIATCVTFLLSFGIYSLLHISLD